MHLTHPSADLPADSLLYPYWGPKGAMRPVVTIFLCGPTGNVTSRKAVIDTGSPFICFSDDLLRDLNLSGPFSRTLEARGAGGEPLDVRFPDDGLIQIFLSDFQTEWFIWTPLVGIFPTRPARPYEERKQTAILGWTGFLQHFALSFLDHPSPLIDVTAKTTYPGRRGTGRPRGTIWAITP